MNKYIERVLAETKAKNANEPEFLQTVEEVLSSLEPVIEAHPEYEKAAIFFKLCILSLKSNTQLLLRLAVGTAFSGSLNHRSIENPARQKTSRYFA